MEIKGSFNIEPLEIKGSLMCSLARTLNNTAIPYGIAIPEALTHK